MNAPDTDTTPRGYPRPMLRRPGWTSLDGPWSFAIDRDGGLHEPSDVRYERTIDVPFAPETPKSRIGETGHYKACWYRRSLAIPTLAPGERLFIHFGAVDYAATVWLDGRVVARHEGGYTPFSAEITRLVRSGQVHELVVRAEDDPHDLAKPRGKQDWQLAPHSIWYPRTTGIWQSVWMERVGRAHVRTLRWTPNLARWEIGVSAVVDAPLGETFTLVVRLQVAGTVLAVDRYLLTGPELNRRIALADPGIDDFRNELLWRPAKPTLIDAEIELLDASSNVVDRVSSYTALRSFTIQNGHFVLNGRPFPLRAVLDQGYWPESGATAPDDAALRRDVELAKAMGFNAVRKHQKIEDPRYLHWADRLGLLVWEEMPSAYRFTSTSVERLTREWVDVIARDASHPCIVAWVPFNESWGVPNLPESDAERHYVRAMYHLTKTLDPDRLVIGNDGWESIATDVIGIHDYEADPSALVARYADEDSRAKVLRRERPGGRLIVVATEEHATQPVVLSEFGGIALARDDRSTWGYSTCRSTSELATRYGALLASVHSLKMLSGFCYTQFADTYQEANGLLHADRRPKFPIDEIKKATQGTPTLEELIIAATAR